MRKEKVNLECHDFSSNKQLQENKRDKTIGIFNSIEQNSVSCKKKLAYVPMWVYANVYINTSR